MGFIRLSFLLRLPVAVLFCGLLVCLGGNFPPDNYLANPTEVGATFDEADDDESFDVGLRVVIFEDDLNQHSNWASLDLGNVSRGAALDLRATGPPNV